MNRRYLLVVIGTMVARAAGSPLALAQEPMPHRIAFVHSAIPVSQLTEASETFWVRQFFMELRALGYADGSNLTVERYSAEGRPQRFGNLAREVISRKPALIVANLNPLVGALGAATSTIPIVAIVADPVGFGFAASLGHPGRNITGVSTDAGLELYGKRLQILKETVPVAKTVAYLGLGGEWNGAVGQTLRDAGQVLGIAVAPMAIQEATPAQLRDAFAEVAQQPVDAVVVSGSGDFLAQRQLIVELAHKSRLAAIYPYRDYVQAGGLIAYAPDLGDLARRLAANVHQILQGEKPGDIPIYQATKFELVINLKTAKALGLIVPQTLLARADEIIE